MELHLVGIGIAHLAELLPLDHRLAFLDRDLVEMRVRRQVGLVVLDDDELAVAAQPAPRIDDLARRAGKDRRAGRAADVDSLQAG
jgi:hypothetical protein